VVVVVEKNKWREEERQRTRSLTCALTVSLYLVYYASVKVTEYKRHYSTSQILNAKCEINHEGNISFTTDYLVTKYSDSWRVRCLNGSKTQNSMLSPLQCMHINSSAPHSS